MLTPETRPGAVDHGWYATTPQVRHSPGRVHVSIRNVEAVLELHEVPGLIEALIEARKAAEA